MTEQKREINAAAYIQQYAKEYDPISDMYIMTLEHITLLLRTYGKELLLEAAERADVTADELGQPIVNATTITHIIDSL